MRRRKVAARAAASRAGLEGELNELQLALEDLAAP
jgi:hypothetical protein